MIPRGDQLVDERPVDQRATCCAWDIDNNVGPAHQHNVYRYSRNVLFGLNCMWFIGRSGRYTDPYLFSREQRFNELEFTFTYEI